MENRKQITDLHHITRALDKEALYKLDCANHLQLVREFNVYIDKRDEFDGIVWVSAIHSPETFVDGMKLRIDGKVKLHSRQKG